jgi:hypothetical protein
MRHRVRPGRMRDCSEKAVFDNNPNGRDIWSTVLLIASLRPDGRIACRIKTSQTTAILAFSTAMRKAGRTDLSLLQCQASGSMTGVALTSALAMRAFTIGFRHYLISFLLMNTLNADS